MWAICELKTNYALKHTYQLRGICELTSETYFHVALAEQLSVFKTSPILLGARSPPPPPHNNPHTPISSEIASFWTPHLLTLEFPLPSVAEVQIFLELHIVRAHLSGMRERSSVGRENAVILFFFL